MASGKRYPRELRERSVRLVAKARREEPELSLNRAVLRIGPRVGVNPDTLRGWVKQARIDTGEIPGRSTGDLAHQPLDRAARHLDAVAWPSPGKTARQQEKSLGWSPA